MADQTVQVINIILSNVSKGTGFLYRGVTNCPIVTICNTLMKKPSAFINIGQKIYIPSIV